MLFHVTPEATWSNLPISGNFVEMLRRIVQLSRNQGAAAANAEGQPHRLPPYRLMAANGALMPPTRTRSPLAAGAGAEPVTHRESARPLWLRRGVTALNLLPQDAALRRSLGRDSPRR